MVIYIRYPGIYSCMGNIIPFPTTWNPLESPVNPFACKHNRYTRQYLLLETLVDMNPTLQFVDGEHNTWFAI